VDADFAADLDTRRSHTGYVIMMNGGPISWKSVKQKSVSLSTAESEWYVANEAGKELLYLPSNRKGARHIDTREHFVDRLVKDRIVKLVQCKTTRW
jgi:hypothetical protein